MNWTDAINAIKDGSYLDWDTAKLHDGISALQQQNSVGAQATYFNSMIETLQAEIRSKQTVSQNKALLDKLVEHNETTKRGVYWAKTAAWAAIAVAVIAARALILGRG